MARPVSWGRIQRPGLALAGFIPYIKPGRIQILGESELNYLDTMPADVRRERIEAICALPIAAFVVTKGQEPPDDVVRECRRREIPLFVSDKTTSVVIQSITRVLEDELAPVDDAPRRPRRRLRHGRAAPRRIGHRQERVRARPRHRGHRLVADDAVEIRRYPSGALVGRAAEMIRYHMELRGIGIINIKHLFGVSAVRASKSVELVIELQRWDPTKKYDRLGLDDETYAILDREMPLLRMPVASGTQPLAPDRDRRAQRALEEPGLRRGQGVCAAGGRGDRQELVRRGPAQVNRLTPAPGSTPESLVVVTGLSRAPARATSTSASRTWATSASTTCPSSCSSRCSARSRPERVGIILDVRNPDFAARFPEILARLRGARAGDAAALPRRLGGVADPPLLGVAPPAPAGRARSRCSRRCAASARCSRTCARWPTSSSTPRP